MAYGVFANQGSIGVASTREPWHEAQFIFGDADLKVQFPGIAQTECEAGLVPLAHYSNQREGDIGKIVRRKERIEITARLICMPLFLGLGCWLVYIGDTAGLRGSLLLCLGCLLIVLFFACGFLPVYWQDKYHRSSNNKPQAHESGRYRQTRAKCR